jgi:arginine deiminase
MAHGELPVGGGLVDRMTEPLEFIIRPLPNVLFTRDSSVWLENGVAVTQLALAARRRETALTGAIYHHHPRFAGTQLLYGGA